MTEALGAVAWRMVEFEADDALATAADRFFADERVRQVVICSPDKDLMQCIRGDRVVTWDRMRRKIYDEAAAIEKMGVPPTSIPDYLALVGDTADGIPGLPRWGARSTAAVLQKYRHLEFIPADENEWEVAVRGAKTLAAGLTEHLEAARLFRTLATLRTDVPLEEGFAELEWKGANRPLLETLAMELGDTSLVERVSRFAP